MQDLPLHEIGDAHRIVHGQLWDPIRGKRLVAHDAYQLILLGDQLRAALPARHFYLRRVLFLEAFCDEQVHRLRDPSHQLLERRFPPGLVDPGVLFRRRDARHQCACLPKAEGVRPGHVDLEAVRVVLERCHAVPPRHQFVDDTQQNAGLARFLLPHDGDHRQGRLTAERFHPLCQLPARSRKRIGRFGAHTPRLLELLGRVDVHEEVAGVAEAFLVHREVARANPAEDPIHLQPPIGQETFELNGRGSAVHGAKRLLVQAVAWHEGIVVQGAFRQAAQEAGTDHGHVAGKAEDALGG